MLKSSKMRTSRNEKKTTSKRFFFYNWPVWMRTCCWRWESCLKARSQNEHTCLRIPVWTRLCWASCCLLRNNFRQVRHGWVFSSSLPWLCPGDWFMECSSMSPDNDWLTRSDSMGTLWLWCLPTRSTSDSSPCPKWVTTLLDRTTAWLPSPSREFGGSGPGIIPPSGEDLLKFEATEAIVFSIRDADWWFPKRPSDAEDVE